MATVADVGTYVGLRRLDIGVVAADIVALGAAAGVSFGLHRKVTLRDDPARRWLGEPGMFGSVVVVAGAADVAVVRALGGSTPHKFVAVAAAAAVRSIAHRMVSFRVIRSDQENPHRGPSLSDGPRLSVVVPAYREVDRIGRTVQRLRSELPGIAPGDLEIVVVDDGSDDGTADAARAAGADIVVELPVNRGKGGAVRAGMAAAHGRTRAFLDADLAYSPDQLVGLLTAIEDGWDVVVGNRHHVATRTLAPTSWLRALGSRVVNLGSQVLLLGNYRDTQCGLKAFRGDVAEVVFPAGFIDGFAFDIELLHLVERYRLSLTEVPVEVQNSERSTVRLVSDTVRLGRDIMRIRRHGKSGGYRTLESFDSLPSGA